MSRGYEWAKNYPVTQAPWGTPGVAPVVPVPASALIMPPREVRAVGGMPYRSKMEARYAQLLETQKYCGVILNWWYEGMKLRLAETTFYTPDFLVQSPDERLECHEVKGYWREDARIKIKVAARAYPCFHFVAMQWVKGAWKEERF